MGDRLRFALIGGSTRSEYLYGPLLRLLSDDVELVAVWSRSGARARSLGDRFGVPWFTDLDALVRDASPQAAVVSVKSEANGEVALRVVDLALHALLETPIAQDLTDADLIISRARERAVKVEVAEQYYRRPIEQLKLALLAAGVFGRVLVAENDFMGHAYHGVSLIRSYIGFDTPVESVSAHQGDFDVASHHAWITKSAAPRREEWEHGIIRFADGRLGVFNWSSLSYDSSLRWWRSTRFFAERGMAIGDRLTVLSKDGKDPERVEVERRFHNVGGMETLSELIALTEPEVRWLNPFRAYFLDDETIATASALMSLVRAVREEATPEYGPEQARLDQEVSLAMAESARRGGEPVKLPFHPQRSRGVPAA
jgi:predicted dehydrogenase